MSERAGLSDKTNATSAPTIGNDNLSTYANQSMKKDNSQDKTPGLTTLDTEVAIGGGALLLGGGYVAYEGLGDLKSLNGGLNLQLSSLNSQIGKGLGTLQGDITGLEAQLPTLQLGLTSGVTSLAGIQQELGALNTNLTNLEVKGLTGQGALSLESTIKPTALTADTASIGHPTTGDAASSLHTNLTGAHNQSGAAEQLSVQLHATHVGQERAQLFQDAISKGDSLHAFGTGVGHLTLMPHADFRTALERGPEIGTMAAFHGLHLGNIQLKEHASGAMFHAKAGASAMHMAAHVHAPMVKAAHVKVK